MSKSIYLDNQATTPIDPRVLEVMQACLQQHFGNSSSTTHAHGWIAQELVEVAREHVAKLINAAPSQIIFTSGATESNNLALLGFLRRQRSKTHVISATTEHRAVIDPLLYANKSLADVQFLDVDSEGLVNVSDVANALKENTSLASFMFGNNETGVLNDVEGIAKVLTEKNVAFHCDATQALGKVDFDVKKINPTYASFSAHKIYGPKGIGAIFIASPQAASMLEPLTFGGGQEKGIRPGTLNVPAIVGFGEACRICFEENDRARIGKLRDKLLNLLQSQIDGVKVNGSLENRLSANLNVVLPGVQSAELIGAVSKDISISSASACSSGSNKPSHVLTALKLSSEEALSSVRIGVGRFNTDEEIEKAARVIIAAYNKIK